MDLRPQKDVEDFRQEVREFLATHLPSDWKGIGGYTPERRKEFRSQWREVLRENGYLAVAWPAEYGGGGMTVAEQSVVQEEFTRLGVPLHPHPNDSFGFSLIGPTLLHWGTKEQKEFFIPRILSGEHRWAQGYSEPDAGSDLFGLRTRAVLDGDEWVINGQKVWQTAGDTANWIFVLVRTDPDVPKAKGLSLVLVPIEQPGIEVRTIRTMTGESEFCEVLFNNARTDAANVVGGVNNGAHAALTLLGYERGAASGATAVGYRIELDRLLELARQRGRTSDPSVRQGLAACYTKVEILRYLGLRTLTGAMSGGSPGPESSITKLYTSEYHKQVTELAVDILGAEALISTGDGPATSLGPDPFGAPNTAHAWEAAFYRARAGTIYGGSSQIQRNTLGEQVLGLPREPRPT